MFPTFFFEVLVIYIGYTWHKCLHGNLDSDTVFSFFNLELQFCYLVKWNIQTKMIFKLDY